MIRLNFNKFQITRHDKFQNVNLAERHLTHRLTRNSKRSWPVDTDPTIIETLVLHVPPGSCKTRTPGLSLWSSLAMSSPERFPSPYSKGSAPPQKQWQKSVKCWFCRNSFCWFNSILKKKHSVNLSGQKWITFLFAIFWCRAHHSNKPTATNSRVFGPMITYFEWRNSLTCYLKPLATPFNN